MKRKRLNVTRRAGSLYFRRETHRLSDGSPDGEILWVYSSLKKPRKAVPVMPFNWLDGRKEVSILLGTYRIMAPVAAAKAIRAHIGESEMDKRDAAPVQLARDVYCGKIIRGYGAAYCYRMVAGGICVDYGESHWASRSYWIVPETLEA